MDGLLYPCRSLTAESHSGFLIRGYSITALSKAVHGGSLYDNTSDGVIAICQPSLSAALLAGFGLLAGGLVRFLNQAQQTKTDP